MTAGAGKGEGDLEREHGTIIKRVGPVAIACMDPDARDAMDETIAAYEQFKGLTHDEIIDRGIYGFAYWLYRYSGLVTTADDHEHQAEPPEPRTTYETTMWGSVPVTCCSRCHLIQFEGFGKDNHTDQCDRDEAGR